MTKGSVNKFNNHISNSTIESMQKNRKIFTYIVLKTNIAYTWFFLIKLKVNSLILILINILRKYHYRLEYCYCHNVIVIAYLVHIITYILILLSRALHNSPIVPALEISSLSAILCQCLDT